MTLYSEIWGEAERSRTMMGTQTFTSYDQPSEDASENKAKTQFQITWIEDQSYSKRN